MRQSIGVSVKFEEFLFKIQYLNLSVANKERFVAIRIHRRGIHKASMAGKMVSAVDAFLCTICPVIAYTKKRAAKKAFLNGFL